MKHNYNLSLGHGRLDFDIEQINNDYFVNGATIGFITQIEDGYCIELTGKAQSHYGGMMYDTRKEAEDTLFTIFFYLITDAIDDAEAQAKKLRDAARILDGIDGRIVSTSALLNAIDKILSPERVLAEAFG